MLSEVNYFTVKRIDFVYDKNCATTQRAYEANFVVILRRGFCKHCFAAITSLLIAFQKLCQSPRGINVNLNNLIISKPNTHKIS